MPASNTYEPIATTTLTSATSEVSLSSIPSTYTDMIIVVTATTTADNTDIQMYFNSDNTSGLYSKNEFKPKEFFA